MADTVPRNRRVVSPVPRRSESPGRSAAQVSVFPVVAGTSWP